MNCQKEQDGVGKNEESSFNMAAATDELILLERVFLRLGSAETDEQLQAAVCKFLPPVLLKLSSTQEGVRKKVMELLIHISKRVKSRPQVQLPVEALLLQYQDPTASSFVINFTIIYIKIGYPRMEQNKQAELIPSILNALDRKPLSHKDSLLLIIMPALGYINIPMDPEKRASLLGLEDKPNVSKELLSFMLDMLLLPYGAIGQPDNQMSGQPIDFSQYRVPPGLSEYAFKRVIGEAAPSAEQLEQIKLGIVKFISGGFFPESDILIHLIVASADTRFSVANLAELRLKKIVCSLDWSTMQLAAPLYTLFLGNDAVAAQKDIKPEMKRQPANTRIRLKLLHYLCRVTKAGFIIPPCIQVVFDSLYGTNTTLKLKLMALQFTSNIVQQCSLTPLVRVAGVILNGMVKLISASDDAPKSMAYTVIGQLSQRIPTLINKDLSLLQHFFDTLSSAEPDLRRTVRDALIMMTNAYVLPKDDETSLTTMNFLLASHIESNEANVRFVAVHYAASVFPQDDIPSRYLLLLASGDSKPEVNTEAVKALYGTSYKTERYKESAKETFLPDFPKLVIYIHSKLQSRLSSHHPGKVQIGSKTLPYNVATFTEIITYLRFCLVKSANVPVQSEPLQHPCQYTPIVGRYLKKLFEEQPEAVNNYLDIIIMFAQAVADNVSLNALLEVVGTIPQHIIERFEKELTWLRSQISVTNKEIRECAAKIYAVVMAYLPEKAFEEQVLEFIKNTKNKNLEAQHGALFALACMIQRKLLILRNDKNKEEILNWSIYKDVVKTIYSFLDDNNPLLVGAAVQGIGLIGRTFSLPLQKEKNTDANKEELVEKLFSILTNSKVATKVKEEAALSLGYICVGEKFPYTTEIAEKFIALAAETKDIEIHFTVGESLICCIQGEGSLETRDSWNILPSEFKSTYSVDTNALLSTILEKLLQLSKIPHPNSKQSSCIWLLALLKHNAERPEIKEKLFSIQRTFMDLLSENSDIIQDVASKGISLVYNNVEESQRKALVSELSEQLLHGRKSVQEVTSDTKLFEEGQLGKSPTGGNLTTYKEICSLASDLNKPELVYRFMHLANHNSIWTSKKGAAYGFSVLANLSVDELNPYLNKIIPKLYRYQFDPTPNIQQHMARIWNAIVPSTNKALETYHKEILEDIIVNLTNNQWRVRISCCQALSDVLRSNAPINLIECAPELWKQLFRVMDDVHEGTRLAATNTAQILSKVCIRNCDVSNGKAGEELLKDILPILLDVGIKHTVDTVRAVSFQTVSQLVTTAGDLLKPFLCDLIPALLIATGELENPILIYASNILAATDDRDDLDNRRARAAKSHYTTETTTKCVQYVDATILKDLMPKVIEILKSSIGLGTQVACSHFLILLSSHMKQEMQPFTGKLLSALLHGLNDRNAAIRKTNAVTIGHIVGSAKESSLEKLFKTLNTWYMEKEDDSIRLSIAQALHSINSHNQEILKKYMHLVIPLTFFAMHAEKVPGNENFVETWTELWSEIAPGTELGIKAHLLEIITMLNSALESSSWSTKAQAANSVSTIASKLGSNIDKEARNNLLKILTNGLQGRTWNGKERLLNALAILACNSKEVLQENEEFTEAIIEALLKESKKNAGEYRRFAIKAFSDVLHELNIDRFTQIYEIAQDILTRALKKDSTEDDGTDNTKKREENILLQEAVYEALGKAWPCNKHTQEKYCVEFVTHCNQTLPNTTRPVQAAILKTLNLFVDKLILLVTNASEITLKERETLDTILETLYKIIKYSIGISKYTRIRKEALNIVLSLSKKLKDTQNEKQIENLSNLFKEVLPELLKDNQPEIRTRVVDIRNVLKV